MKVDPDAPLRPDQFGVPVRWLVPTPATPVMDASDDALAPILGPGRANRLKTFGHDGDGLHVLLTRGCSPLHVDPRYTRWSHQLIVRNDGRRVRGVLDDPEDWHPPMTPGVMYCLDTWSPHGGAVDTRMTQTDAPPVKLVIAVDRDDPLSPAEAWDLLSRWMAHPLPDYPGRAA